MDRKRKVLVVDDEKELVSLVNLHMKMAGLEPIYAFDGEEALKAAKEKRPDIIILDLMLPKMDGMEVCRIIREDPDLKATPVIMLTAKSTTEDKLKGFESGADDYVTKPFSPKELVARVKRILQRSESQATGHKEKRKITCSLRSRNCKMKRNVVTGATMVIKVTKQLG